MRRYAWSFVALAVLALWAWQQRTPPPVGAPAASTMQATTPGASSRSLPPGADGALGGTRTDTARWPAWLPPEAIDTLGRIERGGPFAQRQDGAVFHNRERLLPPRPRGYYHEYTVPTPGSRDRGARRIVTGDRPPAEYFYSDDHYRSFRRFMPPRGAR
jgi:guanyl-specific ribonuclease Sa